MVIKLILGDDCGNHHVNGLSRKDKSFESNMTQLKTKYLILRLHGDTEYPAEMQLEESKAWTGKKRS